MLLWCGDLLNPRNAGASCIILLPEPEGPDRMGDVLDQLLAQILKDHSATMAQIVANDERHADFPASTLKWARDPAALPRDLCRQPRLVIPAYFPDPDGPVGYGQMADRSASTSTAAAEAAWERGGGDDG